MGRFFSVSEVVQMGIQIEKNGKDFYSRVAELAKTDKVKEAFLFLESEEEKHIKVFKEILSGVEKYEPLESYPEDYFAYLKALSENYVFTEEKMGEEVARKSKDEREAIEAGIGFEKDSILFYQEMKNLIKGETHETIDRLIDEEKKHLTKLYQLKTA